MGHSNRVKVIKEALPPDWEEEIARRTALPTPESGVELGKTSAQYMYDEPKRRRLERAKAEMARRFAAGEIDPNDERASMEAIADLVRQYEQEEIAERGKEYTSTLMGAPPGEDIPPGEIAKAEPLPSRAAQLDAEERARLAAEREREKELAAIKRAPAPWTAEEPMPSEVDDAALRRIGLRPGWQINAIVSFSSETGKPIYGKYRVLDKQTQKLSPAHQDINTRFSRLKHPEHGALMMLMSLKANPRYTVRVWRGERGLQAAAFGPGKEFEKIRSETGRAMLDKIGMGTPLQAQKLAEKAAEAAGVTGLEISPEERPRGAEVADIPSAEYRPKVAEPKEFEAAGVEINDMVLADEDSPGSPAVAWGDYWFSKTPEEITAARIDPRDIDPRMAEDNRLSPEQRSALRRKIAQAPRARGVAGALYAHDLPPEELQKAHKGPGPDLSGRDREITVVDPETGKKYRTMQFGWERPPHEGVIHPHMAKQRTHIQLLVPFLKTYLKTMKNFAERAVKPITGRTIGWQQIAGEEIPLRATKEMKITGDTPCANREIDSEGKPTGYVCRHPARDHAGWRKEAPDDAFECQNPECMYQKRMKQGHTTTESRCQHYVPSDEKEVAKRERRKLSFKKIDDIATELAKLPSSWGSQERIYMPPHSPSAIDAMIDKDPDKAIEMQREIAGWYERFGHGTVHASPTIKPPHSKEKVIAAKDDPTLFKKLYDDNEKWWKTLEKRAKDNKTVVTNVNAIYDWSERARKNLWGTFRKNMIDRWKSEIFGKESSDPRVNRLMNKFIDAQVFGPTKGLAPDPSAGRRQAFATAEVSELPFAEKIRELEKKAVAQKGMKKWEADELNGYRMARARRPDMTPESMEQRFNDMFAVYNNLSEKLKNHTVLGDALISYLRYLSSNLAGSGGWGIRADEKTLERRGTSIRNIGQDYPKKRAAGVRGVPPVFPTIRPGGEVEKRSEDPEHEAEKARQRADLMAKKIEPGAAKPAAKRPAFPAEKIPGQLGHVKWPEPERYWPETKEPQLDIAASVGREGMKELEGWLEQQQREYEEEMRRMGYDPSSFYGDIPGKKTDEGLMRRLEHIETMSSANVAPKWYDDI